MTRPNKWRKVAGVFRRNAGRTPHVSPKLVNHISVDEARLRPHLRDNTRSTRHLQHHHHSVEHAERRQGHRTTYPTGPAGGDPIQLRGIPAIGRTVTGVIPHTQPEQETIHRSQRRRPAA